MSDQRTEEPVIAAGGNWRYIRTQGHPPKDGTYLMRYIQHQRGNYCVSDFMDGKWLSGQASVITHWAPLYTPMGEPV